MPLETPTTALEGTLFAKDPQVPSPADTQRALPLSDDARGNRQDTPPDDPGGDSIPAAPEPPGAPDYPRVDTSQREAPEVNQEARNRQALAGLLGTLGTAFASAGDDPTMLNISAGLSQGAGDQLRQRHEEFKRRQQAFNEFLTQAQRFNREMQQRETQADYERRLSAFEQQSEARQGALDRRADRRQSQAEDQRQHEQTLEEIRERGEQRRRTQRVENQNSGGGGGGGSEPIQMDDLSIPNDPAEAERRLNMVNARLDEMRANKNRFQYQEQTTTTTDEGVPQDTVVTRTDEDFLRRLGQLEQYRSVLEQQVLEQRGENGSPGPTRSGPAATRGSRVNPGDVPNRGGRRQRENRQQDQTSQRNGQEETDPVRQAARQQAPQVDTVTQADIGAAVEQFGEGADEVRLLREIRQIQQNQ